jgi:PBP1b-binding outer membrane lipoprotein LpoB
MLKQAFLATAAASTLLFTGCAQKEPNIVHSLTPDKDEIVERIEDRQSEEGVTITSLDDKDLTNARTGLDYIRGVWKDLYHD